jgi:hypothetical protein
VVGRLKLDVEEVGNFLRMTVDLSSARQYSIVFAISPCRTGTPGIDYLLLIIDY